MTTPTRIDTLSPEQLQNLGQHLETDLQRLEQSANALGRMASSYASSASAVEELNEAEEGQQMLVPLTESLYVSGRVHNKDRIMVDIGTGYYAEKDGKAAADFCARRIAWLREQMDAMGEQIRNKQNGLQQVQQLLQARMQQASQQQQVAGQKAVAG